jgi:hypothetical protein
LTQIKVRWAGDRLNRLGNAVADLDRPRACLANDPEQTDE